MVGEPLFRVVELVFTSYAVPGLLVPLLWFLRRVAGQWLTPAAAPDQELDRLTAFHLSLATGWLVLWGVMWLGVPLAKGGTPAVALCWVAYALANITLALLLMRFTSLYGSLAPGAAADRLFTRLMCAVLAQPILTALAFSVLFRLTGVAWHLALPGAPAVQEGI